jgi:hypothetical protein
MSLEVRAAMFPSSYLVVSESNLLRAITVFCSPDLSSRAWHVLLIANLARFSISCLRTARTPGSQTSHGEYYPVAL